MEGSESQENSTERKGSTEDKRSVKSADCSLSPPSDKKPGLFKRSDSLRETKSEGDAGIKKVNFAIGDKKGSLEKRGSLREIGNKGEVVQRKFVSTWKLACDKTRDRTKELLKKWRTVPEHEMVHQVETHPNPGWSVHVWTTWVKRYPSEEDNLSSDDHNSDSLTSTQKEKLTNLFSHIFDMDKDEIISLQDFESFTERLRHFADWTINSGEYLILLQIQQGIVEAFLSAPLNEKQDGNADEAMVVDLYKQFLSLEDWLWVWSRILKGVKSFQELPVWLQYLPRVIFQAINKSGTGRITRDELSAFYSSVMGFSAQRVGEIIDEAFKVMTSNGDSPLSLNIYKLCFANLLLGRYPNGPGQYMFGILSKPPELFPIDYSAMNATSDDIEQYAFDGKSNRRSVMV